MERQIWSLAVGGICLLIFSLFPEMLTPPNFQWKEVCSSKWNTGFSLNTQKRYWKLVFHNQLQHTELFITQLQSLQVHLHSTSPNEFLIGAYQQEKSKQPIMLELGLSSMSVSRKHHCGLHWPQQSPSPEKSSCQELIRAQGPVYSYLGSPDLGPFDDQVLERRVECF